VGFIGGGDVGPSWTMESGEERVDRTVSTAEEVMTTGVVSRATVGRLPSLGEDMESASMAGISSSGRPRDGSSRWTLTNCILAAATSMASRCFSLSPSSFEVATSLRLVMDSSSIVAS